MFKVQLFTDGNRLADVSRMDCLKNQSEISRQNVARTPASCIWRERLRVREVRTCDMRRAFFVVVKFPV